MSASDNPLINGLGGSAGFGENILGRNDDSSTGFIDVTSVFESGLNFFGTTYNGFYINNNGNITFGNSSSTYTPFALTGNTGIPIIAPFFTDIDTRAGNVTPSTGGNSTGSNLVYWDIDDQTSDAVTITWDDVGQYSYGTTPNAFQLRLKDIGQGNFTLEFRYEDIQWYGGNARAGYSAANGINFFEFSQSGTSAMLDLETSGNTSQPGVFLFSVVNGTPNQPPTDIALSQSSVDENSFNNTVIGSLTTTDPDVDEVHTYTLLNDADGRFAINGNQIVVANGANLNYETNSSHNIIVRTRDIGGLTHDKSFTITINNVPEPDLSITATAPDTANLGETIQVSWTVTNQGDGVALADWADYVYLSDDTELDLDGSDKLLTIRTIDVQTPLVPHGEGTEGTYEQLLVNVTIPETATTGSKYLLFVTNRDNNQHEDNKTNNLQARAIALTAPDLQVESLDVVSNNILGNPIILNWTVRNTGDGAATKNWRDRFYLSTDETISTDDLLIWTEEINNTTPLAKNSTYSKSATTTLPLNPNLSEGTYYILLATDADKQQLETSDSNNKFSVSRDLTLPPLPDLVVSNITSPPTEFSGRPIEVSWTLRNQGNGVASGTWSEQIYLSSDAEIGGDQLIGTFEFTGTIAAGQPILRKQEITLPVDWSGDYWIVVKTDTSNQVYEHNKESNNTDISAQPINIHLSDFPNLQVTEVFPPVLAFSGTQTEVSWTVKNTGLGATNTAYWYDEVWLSQDSNLDPNGDYYLGRTVNPRYLNSGESYGSSLIFTLPQGIDGNWKFLVRTDPAFSTFFNNYPNGLVYEHNGENDNIKDSSPIPVQLTVPPDLQVTKVTVAPSSPFSGQQVTLSWRVTNEGFGRTAPAENSWYDQLYVAKNPDGTGEFYDLGRVIHNGALQAGAFYDASYTVTLPIGKWGDYFFVVVTDAGRQVYELTSEDNNIGFLDADKNDAIDTPTKILLTPPPDLTVDSVTVANNAVAGKSLTINYQVSNQGPTAVPTRTPSWNDAFYLSTSSTDLNLSTAIYLGSKRHNGILDTDGTDQFYKESATFTLRNDISGDYYVFVVTDSGNSIFEQDDVDANTSFSNISHSANSVSIISQPADLLVTTFEAPATVTAGKTARISWSVFNQGTGDTIATRWTDRLVASKNNVLGDSDDIQLGEFTYDRLLLPSGSYSRTEDVLIPFQLVGDYSLFLETDKYQQVYEGVDENNNTSITSNINRSITVSRQTPDLQVTKVSTDPTAASGTTLSVRWTVKNTEIGSTNADYWYDEIFLSSDEYIDQGDTLLGRIRHSGTLAGLSEYDATADVLLPLNLSGSFRVLVNTDSYSGYDSYGNNNRVLEVSESNNTNFTTPATVISLSPVPELTVNSVDAPISAISGQSFSLTWSVSNTGASTGNRTWYDAVYLSLDQVFNRSNGDIYLGSFIHNGGLAHEESYSETQSFNLPRGLSGPFYVFVATDSGNAIDERGSELNNIDYDSTATQVILPPPADLKPVADSLVLPPSAHPGEIITINNYSVHNQGGEAALGNWYDAFYLSADEQWDINDIQIGLVQHSGDVASGSSYSNSLIAALPGVIPGNYHVLLRSDIRNQVAETNESNNTVSSLGTVAIDFESLQVGGSVSDTLQQGEAIYYKIQATAGQALRLHLDSQDNNSVNELYVRYGQLPTRGQFDRTADNPFLADPDFVFPVNQDGTYYVMAYGSNVSGSTNYTLTATDVPFSVTGVETNVVGNTGQATVKVKGARFASDTSFQLVDSQGNTISQLKARFKDSTTAFVTFDFKGKDVGSYSIQAIQSTSASTTLAAALTVQEGVGAVIDDAINGPQRVWAGQKYPINISYSNSGDIDSAAPLLLVRNKNSATGTTPRYENANQEDKVVQLYGVGADVETGLLRPKESHSIPLYFAHLGNENQGAGVSVESVSTEDSTFISTDDWMMLKQSAKPASVSDENWSAFWSTVQPGIGETWGDYAQLIAQLSKGYNNTGENIYDVSELFNRWYADTNSTFFQFHPKPSISGQLIDKQTGLPADGIVLEVYQEERPGRYFYELATDQQGKFSVASLSPGTYKIVIPNGYSFVNTDNSNSSLNSSSAIYTIPVSVDSGDISLQLDINPPAPPPFDPSYLSLFRTKYPESEQQVAEIKEEIENRASSYNTLGSSGSSASSGSTDSYLFNQPSSFINTFPLPPLPPPSSGPGGGGDIIWESPFGTITLKPTGDLLESRECTGASAKSNFSVDSTTPFGLPDAAIYANPKGSFSVKSEYVVDKEKCLYKHDKTSISGSVDLVYTSTNPIKTVLWIAEKFFPQYADELEHIRDVIQIIDDALRPFGIKIEDYISAKVGIGGGFGGKVSIEDSGRTTGAISLRYVINAGFDFDLTRIINQVPWLQDIAFKGSVSISGTISQQVLPLPDLPKFQGTFSYAFQLGNYKIKPETKESPEIKLPLIFNWFPNLPQPSLPIGENVGKDLLQFFKRNLSDYSLPEKCDCKPEDYSPTLLKSADPNDILGPDGYGTEKWVSATTLDYTIRFENMATATAPAKQVVISQKLDSDLDWRSFRLGSFSWGDLVFQAPENRAFYSDRIDLREKYGIYADITAFIDITTGEAKWEIKAIDPETGDIPTDPLKGFLPPNNESHVGEGFVTYTIKSKSTTQTGNRIDAQARIVFDNNEPIDTPSIFNTVDLGNPISAVDALPSSINTSTFLVKWAGNDSGGSGLATYNVYVSKDDAPFELWQGKTTLTEATFTGEGGHTYKFYSLATDNAGNQQDVSTATPVSVEILSPGTLAFSTPTFSVNEDGTTIAAVTITRTNGSYGAVEVTLSLSGGTATGGTQPYASGVDYDNSPITVSFVDGETSKTIAIPVNNDTQLESNETIYLSLSNPIGGAVIGQQSNAVLALVDNDTNLNFSLTPEAEISAQVLMAFTEATSYWTSLFSNTANINITIGFRDLGAGILAQNVAERSNFAYADVYNALFANQTSADDFNSASNLQSGSAFSLLLNRTSNNPTGSGSITSYLDNDGDANNTTIRVNRANAKALGLISANASGQDAMLILNNNSSLTWDFDPSDGISFGAYDFVGLVAHEIGHTLGFDSGVDVLDSNPPAPDDGYTYVTPMDLFRFSTASTAYGNGVIDWTASTTDKYFSIDGGTTKLASFATGVNYGDGQQSSHWKDNLGLGIMDPTIALGERIQISALDKQVFDVIGWNLLDTITNYAKLSFGAATFSISEDGTPINAVTVIRTGSTTGSVSATITFSDDTAISPADYDNTPIVVTFASGETFQTVTIPIINDTLTETLENIQLTLGSPTGGAAIGIQNTATLSILDDDVQLNFSTDNYVVREDGTAVTNIIITRTGRATGTVGGTITFTDGTANGCGCGPNSVTGDFHNGSITFTLGDNEMSKAISVELASLGGTNAIRIRNDAKIEGDENFTITLTDPTNGATIGSQSSATVTIWDDDVELAFSDTNFSINEDGTAIAAVTITRTGRSTGAVGATISLSNGTAISGSDYNNAPIIVNFADGEMTKTVVIPIVDDTVYEGDETINLTLSNPTGGATIVTQSTATVTIKENDTPPPITLIGTRNDDNLVGGDGNDLLDGKEGNDTLIGNAGNDNLIGGTGNDTLDGGTGNDTLDGGTGNDTYIVDSAADTVVENASSGTDTVMAAVDFSIAFLANVENLVLVNNAIAATANSLSNKITGNAQDNILSGNAGNDSLDGGAGNDTLIGGVGNDTYTVDSIGDMIVENSNEGTDTVNAAVDYSLAAAANVEKLVLVDNAVFGTGNSLNNYLYGNDLNNILDGGAGNDYLYGEAGNDTLYGGDGNEYLYGDIGDDYLDGAAGSDRLNGEAGNDSLNGGDSNDYLYGGDGNDTLDGGAGNDSLYGQAGNDILNGGDGNDYFDPGTGVDNVVGGLGSDDLSLNLSSATGDIVVNYTNLNAGTVSNGTTFSEIESIILTTGSGNDTINLSAAVDSNIHSGSGQDAITTGAGNDYLYGEAGNDTLNGAAGNDYLYGGIGDDYLDGGAGNDYLYGEAGNDTLNGGDGNDTLNGGTGDDVMNGGLGTDTYFIDSASDSIFEDTNAGIDSVNTSITWTLGNNLENLTLTGTSAIDGIGNILNNTIAGNSGANNLFGNEGNDSLSGNNGDDLLDGGTGDDTLLGGSGNDVLIGNFGNDVLTGSTGADIFVLNSPNQGVDRITDFSSVDDTLHVSAAGFGGGLTAGDFIMADQILIGSGAVATTSASQRFIYNTSTGALFFDADGNQTGFGAVQIATLSNKPTIGSNDIFVIA
jgi:Ca2+-binding RTX toxin-like protein